MPEDTFVTIQDYKTCKLVEELKAREGVEVHIVDPYVDFQLPTVSGPAIILHVID